jgi:hypothetical protein
VNNYGTICRLLHRHDRLAGRLIGTLNQHTLQPNFTTFTVPGTTATQILWINDSGVIFGQFTGAQNVTHGFVDQNGVITTIDGSGAVTTTINVQIPVVIVVLQQPDAVQQQGGEQDDADRDQAERHDGVALCRTVSGCLRHKFHGVPAGL